MASGSNLDDGFYIKNVSKSTLRFVAYDANKQIISASLTSSIPNQHTQYLSTENIGSSDFVYLLAFYDNPSVPFNPPPGIGIIADGHGTGGGGGFSISIEGIGFGLSGSGQVSVTDAFSQPSLVAQMQLHTYDTRGANPNSPPTQRWSCLMVGSGVNERGEEVLQPVFVPGNGSKVDSLIPSNRLPPGWVSTYNRWFFGGGFEPWVIPG